MTGPAWWNSDTQKWEHLRHLSGVVHMVCCDENWSLCDEDLTGDTDPVTNGLGEREEWCLKCLRQDNANHPCSDPLCPLRPRSERFRYLWRRRQHRQAVGQLLSWRKP